MNLRSWASNTWKLATWRLGAWLSGSGDFVPWRVYTVMSDVRTQGVLPALRRFAASSEARGTLVAAAALRSQGVVAEVRALTLTDLRAEATRPDTRTEHVSAAPSRTQPVSWEQRTLESSD